MCIQTGWIVWVNGPFPCGEWSDLKIALDSVVHLLTGDERIIADDTYKGHPEYFDIPWKHLDNPTQRSRKSICRARHETVNRRFKKWQCMAQRWRHPLHKHGIAFHAVANIEQMLIMETGNVYQVEYFDRDDNEWDV